MVGYIHSPNVCSMEKIGSYIWGQAEWIQEKTYILASLMCINSIQFKGSIQFKKKSFEGDPLAPTPLTQPVFKKIVKKIIVI